MRDANNGFGDSFGLENTEFLILLNAVFIFINFREDLRVLNSNGRDGGWRLLNKKLEFHSTRLIFDSPRGDSFLFTFSVIPEIELSIVELLRGFSSKFQHR